MRPRTLCEQELVPLNLISSNKKAREYQLETWHEHRRFKITLLVGNECAQLLLMLLSAIISLERRLHIIPMRFLEWHARVLQIRSYCEA